MGERGTGLRQILSIPVSDFLALAWILELVQIELSLKTLPFTSRVKRTHKKALFSDARVESTKTATASDLLLNPTPQTLTNNDPNSPTGTNAAIGDTIANSAAYMQTHHPIALIRYF